MIKENESPVGSHTQNGWRQACDDCWNLSANNYDGLAMELLLCLQVNVFGFEDTKTCTMYYYLSNVTIKFKWHIAVTGKYDIDSV